MPTDISTNSPDLSIIIVNWNTSQLLKECLQSIFQETQSISYEIIVIDNGSIDGSAKMVEEKFPSVTLILNSENLGFPAANNQGLHIGNGRYRLLLNSDTLVINGALENLVRFADKHPEAGCFGGLMLRSDRTIDPICNITRFDAVGVWAYYLFLHKLRSTKSLLEREYWETDSLLGAFMMIRNEIYVQVGGMDERFFLMSEDTDWCLRIRATGAKIYYYSGAQIVHYGSESFKKSWDRGIITGFTSKELLFEKHFNSANMLSLRLATIVGTSLRVAGLLLLALIGNKNVKAESGLRCKAYKQVFMQCLGFQSFAISKQKMLKA